MARDNVVSFDQIPGGGRRRVADARTHELVARCRRHLADTLPRLMQELFEHVDDELYQLADKSASDVLQTRYFDAMRELRKLRDSIEQAFLNGHLETFDKFWLHPQVSSGDSNAEAPADDELALVDNDELEENLAVSGMVSKAENRYHRELFALNMRFAQMVGIPDLTTRQNPVGPFVMADGFRDAMRQWSGELGVRLVVFKLFDRYVMGYVGGLYDELNDTLVEAGVLPKIVQRVRRNPVAPSVQRARQESPPSTPPPIVDGDAAVADEVSQEQILGLLGQLLSARRGHGAINLHSSYLPGGGGGAEFAHLPVVASNELLNALHGLQREASIEAPVSRAEIEQLQGEMLINLGRQLEMGSADAPAKRLNQVDQDLIDVVGMLFEFILDDSNVPEAMKALLGRLQIPMLKVAVIDRSFFSNKQHPARRLLNALAKAGMAWVDDGDRSAKSLYGRIETIVTRILGEFSDDVGLFAQLYDEFANFVEREARGAEVAEERINQVTRGQEQLLIARRRVAEVLNDFRVANPDLPTAVVNILREGWHDVMLLAYLREGEESVAWKHAFDAVEELIWSVQPKIEQPERQKLLKAIPDLLKKLRDGLNNISFDQHRAGQLFKDLQTCHIAALRGESDAGDSTLLEEVIPDSLLRGVDEEQEVIEDQHTDLARAMVVGKWIEWRGSDDSWVRGKLSWRSEVTSNCIFVNRKGMKVAEMTVIELAALFRDGRARVLDDLNTPLMDRALSAMLGALKDTGGDAQPA